MFGRTFLFASAFAALLLIACAQPRGQDFVLSYQLERSFALAEIYTAPHRIDIGTEAARVNLLDGWSWNESNSEGVTFVWSNGRASTIAFLVFEPRDSVLSLRGLSFAATDAPGQSVKITVGQEDAQRTVLGEYPVTPTFTDLRVPVPADAMRPGSNLFRLEYQYIRSDLASQQEASWRRAQRDFGVAWESAELASQTNEAEDPKLSSSASAEPVASSDLVRSELTLGGGTIIEYELEIAPGSRLTTRKFDCNGCEGAEARVDVFVGKPDEFELRKAGTLSRESSTVLLTERTSNPAPTKDASPTLQVLLRGVARGEIVLRSPKIERPGG